MRSYCVGLPVVLEFDDAGNVFVEVDMAEASSEMSETYDQMDDHPTENEMLLDSAVVDGLRSLYPVKTMMHAGELAEMRCPVLYACEFRTKVRTEMAYHIMTGTHE